MGGRATGKKTGKERLDDQESRRRRTGRARAGEVVDRETTEKRTGERFRTGDVDQEGSESMLAEAGGKVSRRSGMGRMSMQTRSRVVLMVEAGFRLGVIHKRLQDEGIQVSKTSLCLLIKKYREKGTVRDLRWYKPPRLLSEVHYRFIDEEMAKNMELTSRQLYRRIEEAYPDTECASYL